MSLKKNVPLISHVNSKKFDIYNNEMFYYAGYDKETKDVLLSPTRIPKSAVIKNLDNLIKIPKKSINTMFYLGFAITSHSSQGCTFDEVGCIHEFNKMQEQFPRGLYVALSRFKTIDQVHVEI